jgi:hypothetical protein
MYTGKDCVFSSRAFQLYANLCSRRWREVSVRLVGRSEDIRVLVLTDDNPKTPSLVTTLAVFCPQSENDGGRVRAN